MKPLLLVPGIFACLLIAPNSATAENPAAATDDDSIELFDGKSFGGWEAGGNDGYFRIEDGCVVAGTMDREIPHNFFLCTEESFGNFELTFEAKLVGQGNNAGVQFRSRRVDNSTEVSGYQADIGAAWNRSVWGALYDESRRNKMLAEPAAGTSNEAVKPGDWNRMKVIADGDRIQIFVNGIKTVDYTESDDQMERTGVIGLQIHSGPPTEAWYRNIRLRKLAKR